MRKFEPLHASLIDDTEKRGGLHSLYLYEWRYFMITDCVCVKRSRSLASLFLLAHVMAFGGYALLSSPQ